MNAPEPFCQMDFSAFKLLNAQCKVAKLNLSRAKPKTSLKGEMKYYFFYLYFLKCKRSSNYSDYSEERNSSQSFISFGTYIYLAYT